MAWCLIKDQLEKFREALTSKKLDPFKLAQMNSKERRIEFEKYVDPENAKNINSLFESKLLLKKQVTGFKSWASKVLNISPTAKRDLLSKIDRLNDLGVLSPKEMQSYMEDLASTRLGFNIAFEEAKQINQLSDIRRQAQTIWEEELKNNPKWEDDSFATRKEWLKNEKRIDFGLKQVQMENYVQALILKAKNKRVPFRESPVRAISNPIANTPTFLNDLFKSLMASIDNSFFGRQGIKNLYGTSSQKRIWTNNFVNSFSYIAAELRRKKSNLSPMDLIKADIYSRPNAINGKYKAGNYQLNVLTEEVFPTSLPERIPGLGRLFKASETAFNGSALKMRADLADLFIAKAEKQGLNMKNAKEAKPLGNMIGALTGRGNLGRFSTVSKELNFVMWSARFLKANIDTITAPVKYTAAKANLINKGTKGQQFARAEAAKNTLSIAVHVGALLLFAKLLDPESVDEDPRSTNFGKIKVFNRWVDITGGMSALVILGARLTPTLKNNEWGFWSKSSGGAWTNLSAGNYGQQNAVDVLLDTLFLNKLAPMASIMRDMWKGELFGGESFNIQKSILKSSIPLSFQNIWQLKDESFAAIVGLTLAEMLGLSTSEFKSNTNWDKKTSQMMKDFREQVGDDLFGKANEDFNRAYNLWLEEVSNDPRYKTLSDEGKQKLKTDAKSALEEKILKEYGYRKPIKKPKTIKEIREQETIKRLKVVSNIIRSTQNILDNIDLVSVAKASDDNRILSSIKINGDIVTMSYVNGFGEFVGYEKTNIDDDIGIIGSTLGSFFDAIGRKFNLPEKNISEIFGYEDKQKRLDAMQKVADQLKSDVKIVTDQNINPDTKEKEEVGHDVEKAVSVAPKESVDGIRQNMPKVEKALKDLGIYSIEVLAYAYATIEYETGRKFKPVNEGQYNDDKFGYEVGFTGRSMAVKNKYSGGENYFGRGFIQLTHDYNYKEIGNIIGVDLLKNPELANDEDIAAQILAVFFKEKGVADLVNEGKITQARSKINPDNKASDINKIYKKYLEVLK